MAAESASDVLTWVEDILARTRQEAAAAVDRAEAAVLLRSYVLDLAERHHRQELSPEAMWTLVANEHRRAELAALIDRTIPTTTEGETT